jgi:hypothetical protein
VEDDMKISYLCSGLGEEKRGIAGGYTAQDKNLLPYKDRQVLYITGNVCLDTSCCGKGNWNYIQVIGYLLNDPDKECQNDTISMEVDTVEDQEDKFNLRKILAEKHPGARIEFR